MSKLLTNLKVILFIVSIIFLIVSIFLPQSDCSKCNFKYQGDKIDAKEFMEIYSPKCLRFEREEVFNSSISKVNISNHVWGG